jgi:hypothetical protein
MNMKILLLVVLSSAGAFAQTTTQNGLISFYNRVLQDSTINGGAPRNEPISVIGLGSGGGAADPNWSIGLFWKAANGSYTLANLPDSSAPGVGTFRPQTGGANDGTMVAPVTVEIPNHAAGTPATFQIRAWLTSQGSFDGGPWRGNSPDLTIPQLGGNTASGSLATPNLSGLGFTGFTITPEPSTYALALAGLSVFVLCSWWTGRSKHS